MNAKHLFISDHPVGKQKASAIGFIPHTVLNPANKGQKGRLKGILKKNGQIKVLLLNQAADPPYLGKPA